MIKPHFSRRLSRLFFSTGSRLSRIFCGRLAGLAQIAAGGRLSRRLGGLVKNNQTQYDTADFHFSSRSYHSVERARKGAVENSVEAHRRDSVEVTVEKTRNVVKYD